MAFGSILSKMYLMPYTDAPPMSAKSNGGSRGIILAQQLRKRKRQRKNKTAYFLHALFDAA